MGIIGRLLAGLRGTSDDREQVAQTAASKHTAGDPTRMADATTVAELLTALDQAQGTVAPAEVGRLVERAETDPAAFDGHVPTLLKIVTEAEKHKALPAGAAIAALAESDPALIARHADTLIEILRDLPVADDDDHSVTCEFATDALSTLARRGQVSADVLVAVLAEGSPRAQRRAASVLAVCAASHPGTLPTNWLSAIYEGDDRIARAGAAYVLTILAAERPGEDTGPAPTDEGVVTLAATLRRAQYDGFVTRALAQEAIKIVVEDVAEVSLESFEFASTPMGPKLVLRPSGDTEELLHSEPIDAISKALTDRLGLDDPQIDVQESR